MLHLPALVMCGILQNQVKLQARKEKEIFKQHKAQEGKEKVHTVP